MNAAPVEPIPDILFAELPLPDGSLVRLRVPSADDHISKVYLSGQWYEKDLLDYCYRHFTPGKVFVDVGAFIGGHSVWFALACKAYYVLAIEPNPLIHACLDTNMKHVRAGTVIYVAVGPNLQSVVLHNENPDNLGMARVSQEMDWGQETVTMGRLDSLIDGGHVDVVKIDVEGMAPGVLAGAMETLERYRPALFVECRTEDERIEVTQILQTFGYAEKGVFGWTPTYLFEVA